MAFLVKDINDSDAKKQFFASILTTGFAVIKGANFDFSALEEFYEKWLIFFSSEGKYVHTCLRNFGKGYLPYVLQKNGKLTILGFLESFYYVYGDNKQLSKDLTDITNYLVEQLFLIAQELLGWLLDEISENDKMCAKTSFSPSLQKTCYRIMHYPALKNGRFDNEFSDFFKKNNQNYRLIPHKDCSYITLLPKTKLDNSLQILSNDGSWISITSKIEEPCIVVNIGNSMQLISNGLLKSTLHRVLLPIEPSEPRMSSAFFI